MAENLQFLRRRIKTANNIAQISKAMEMISVSKIKKAQNSFEKNKPYSDKIRSTIKRIILSLDIEKLDNPYLKINTSDNKLYIILSPDKGLAGALPTNLMRKIATIEDEKNYYVTVGKKVEKFVGRLKGELTASFPMGTSLPSYSMLFPILNIITEYYLKGKVGKVFIILTEFKSMFLQSPDVFILLPINLEKQSQEDFKETPYIFEPEEKKLLEELLPYYLEIQLYHHLIQAFTSEQSARMIAMQNAKNNALDIADYLTLSYNKARQGRITNELLDLANVHFS